MTFQDRIILLLEESSQFKEVKDIFKSPLDLVKELIKGCFTDASQGLLKYEAELDAIKKRVAGITRARSLSPYKIADYSPYLFAFQQFFHSSYRARQGEVLEAVVFYSLRSANVETIKEKEQRKRRVKEIFGIRREVTYDIDFFAEKNSNFLLGQIRSTDITGGTTAKGSLVDLLRFILKEKRRNPSARYLIVIWEPLREQQKQSLIGKIWDHLSSEIGSANEERFKEKIEEGWSIPNTSISIRLVYGIEKFGDELNKFAGNNYAKNKLLTLWDTIQKWDDLWLTYAIASLELENLIFQGSTNFQLLNKKLKEIGIDITNNDIRDYKNSSIMIAKKIAEEWTEDSIPVTTPSDMLNYLRDLILLKMIYMKESGYDAESRSITNFI